MSPVQKLLPRAVTLAEMITEMQFQLVQRRRVYGKLKTNGHAEKAEKENRKIAVYEAVLVRLQQGSPDRRATSEKTQHG